VSGVLRALTSGRNKTPITHVARLARSHPNPNPGNPLCPSLRPFRLVRFSRGIRSTSIGIPLITGVDRIESFWLKWINVIHVALTSPRGKPFLTLSCRLHVAQNERVNIARARARQKIWIMASSFSVFPGLPSLFSVRGLLGNGFGATLLYWRTVLYDGSNAPRERPRRKVRRRKHVTAERFHESPSRRSE
jgi:hypothetical protein